MSFREGRFGAIAKLNYDATLELEPWRLYTLRVSGGVFTWKKSLTPASAVHPACRAVHIRAMKSECPIFRYFPMLRWANELPLLTSIAAVFYE